MSMAAVRPSLEGGSGSSQEVVWSGVIIPMTTVLASSVVAAFIAVLVTRFHSKQQQIQLKVCVCVHVCVRERERKIRY